MHIVYIYLLKEDLILLDQEQWFHSEHMDLKKHGTVKTRNTAEHI
jgi:hypothetical protein